MRRGRCSVGAGTAEGGPAEAVGLGFQVILSLGAEFLRFRPDPLQNKRGAQAFRWLWTQGEGLRQGEDDGL